MKRSLSKIIAVVYIWFLIVLAHYPLSYPLDNQDIPALSYTKKEILSKGLVLDIEREETASIRDFDNITKYIAVSPDIVTLSLVSAQELSIIGKKVGSTYVHIWDNEKLMTIRFTVKYRGAKKAKEIRERIRLVEMGEPIKIGYLYDVSKTRSKGDYAPYEWRIFDESHSFSLSGDTPYGYVDGTLRYLFRKNQEGVTDDTDYIDFKFENDYFTLKTGDLFTRFSDVTLPLTHLQGIQFSSGDNIDTIKYDFVMGSTGYYLWGSRLSSFGQMENRLYGLRTEISPQDDLSFFATFMNSVKRTDEAAHDLGSLGVTYKISDYLSFETEVAQNNKKRTAWFSTLKLNIDKLSLNTTYRDINDEFLGLVENIPYRGKRGIYTRAQFKPLDILSFSGSFDLYQDRLNPDPDSPERGNFDANFSSRLFNPLTNTTILYSYYHRQNRGQVFPIVAFGHSCEINQILKNIYLVGDVYGYVRYTPSRYKSFTTGESSFIDETLQGGVRITPIKGLTFSVRETLNYRKWPVRDYSTTPRRFAADMRYDLKIGKLPLVTSLSFGYQKDTHINVDKLSTILGEDKIKGGLELRYNPFSYLNLFMTARLEKIEGSADPKLDRVQTDIFGGVRFLWDTDIRWQGHGTIKGFVFKDINRNGIIDKDDPPLKGVRIFVSEKKYGVTDKNGFYRIRNIKEGVNTVSLDINTIPKNYSSTTPLNVEVAIKKMDVRKANFGVSPKTVIKGFAFNDLDRNGTFQTEVDETLSGLLFELEDGTTAFTDSYGYFTMYNVTPGKHMISINKENIPRGILPYGPIVQGISVDEGETKEMQFIFYALRAVAGRVYIDHNQNQEYDDNEGVEGVKITFQDRTTISDEKGYYILRNLPYGRVEIQINKESIPKHYKVKKDIIRIDLKKEEDIREDIDIELIRKP